MVAKGLLMSVECNLNFNLILFKWAHKNALLRSVQVVYNICPLEHLAVIIITQ